jgi:hypothetical protein
MMDLRETTWSQGCHRQYLLASLYNRFLGHHHHYLLTHLLCKNHMTIRVKRAPAITMMTSLPIHLSNHWPQALEPETGEETEGTVDKEVKDFFAKVKEKRKQEELEAKK